MDAAVDYDRRVTAAAGVALRVRGEKE